MKATSNSDSYGIRRLSAKDTTPKILIISIVYAITWISAFQDNSHDALKTQVKIHPSRPSCWHFCWYREAKRSRRISIFRYSERGNWSRWPARTMARVLTRTRRLPRRPAFPAMDQRVAREEGGEPQTRQPDRCPPKADVKLFCGEEK